MFLHHFMYNALLMRFLFFGNVEIGNHPKAIQIHTRVFREILYPNQWIPRNMTRLEIQKLVINVVTI